MGKHQPKRLGYVRQVVPGIYRILCFFVFPDDYPDAKADDESMRRYAGMYFIIVGARTTAKSSSHEPIQLLRLPRVGQNAVRDWFNKPSQHPKTLVIGSEDSNVCELMGGEYSPLTAAVRMDADLANF